MRFPLAINGGYNKNNPLQFNPADTLNLFLDNYKGEDNQPRNILSATPGLDLENGFTIATEGGVRKLYTSTQSNYIFAIVGRNVYAIDSGLNYIFGIELATKTGYIGIAETDSELLIVDGVNGYVVDKENLIFTKITDTAFPKLPLEVAVLGDRFFVINQEDNFIYFSEINDGDTWSTLNKFKLTTYSDVPVAIKVLQGRLYVFGQRSTEIWILQGGSFPVAPDISAFIDYGCADRGTVAVRKDVLIWLGYDSEGVTSVLATKGGIPKRISSTELENVLQKYVVVNDSTSFMYWHDGILFYQLNFTVENSSWLFNLKNETWTRVGYKDKDRHRGQTITFFNGKNYMGDYQNPYIYEFSGNYYSDNGIAIKRKRITDVFYPNKGQPFTCRHLRIVVQQGIGLENNNEKDYIPQILVRFSRDNGATFGNQMHLKVGRKAQTRIITEIDRLGLFEYGSIVLDMEFYNFTHFNLLEAWVEFDA